MSQILSQEEIDLLITSMGDESQAEIMKAAAGGAEPVEAAGAELPFRSMRKDAAAEAQTKKGYRLYDFRRPEKLSKNQVRLIKGQMEILARQLTNIIADMLRFNTEVSLVEVSQCSYGDIHGASSTGTIKCILSLDDCRSGHGILQFSTALAFSMIERLMGGEGAPEQRVRELTEFERMVFSDVFKRFFDAYCRAMSDFCDLDGKLTHIETDQRLIPKAFSPHETFIRSIFEMRFPGCKDFMLIAIPYSATVQSFAKGKGRALQAATDAPRVTALDIPREVRDMRFAVEVLLGTARSTVRGLLELKAGSVLILDRKRDESLEALINNSSRFKVKPGYVDRKLGAMILSIIDEG
jgi:flagellar motor switch protein FliM